MIMSQLLHFMQPEISKTYLLLTTTKEIQEAIMLSYSKKGIVDQLYDLKKQIANAKKGNRSITNNFNLLNGLLQTLHFIL